MTVYLNCSTFMRNYFVFIAEGESVLVCSRIRENRPFVNTAVLSPAHSERKQINNLVVSTQVFWLYLALVNFENNALC
jgi:hypothetical protein